MQCLKLISVAKILILFVGCNNTDRPTSYTHSESSTNDMAHSLNVDGQALAHGSELFNRLASSKTARLTLQIMMNSKSAYSYTLRDLAEELKLRTAVVDAAHELDQKKKREFPQKGGALIAVSPTTCWLRNPRSWPDWQVEELGATPYIYLSPACTPSQGVDEIFSEHTTLITECNSALKLVFQRAYQKYLGDKKFNELHLGLYETYKKEFSVTAAMSFLPSRSMRKDLLPGDWLNFENPDHKVGAEAWRYENVIYTGNDRTGTELFFGHPFSINTEKFYIEQLSTVVKRGGALPYLDRRSTFTKMDALNAEHSRN